MLLQDKSKNFIKTLNSSKSVLLPKKDRVTTQNYINYNIVNRAIFTKFNMKYKVKERQIEHLSMEMKNDY